MTYFAITDQSQDDLIAELHTQDMEVLERRLAAEFKMDAYDERRKDA